MKNKNLDPKIDHPEHYNQGTMETIEAIEAFLSEEEYLGFLMGNVIKYIDRSPYKGGEEDLKKAEWYRSRLEKKNKACALRIEKVLSAMDEFDHLKF